jgi:NitT/TauT family transport system ATP-binding protein
MTTLVSDRSTPVPFGHFENVHQSFKRAGQVPLVAIENITFDLQAGSLVTLLGPSGCGKTTFLKIVAGLMSATSGTVQIGGRDVVEPHPDFGVVFQQANLMPWRTVLTMSFFRSRYCADLVPPLRAARGNCWR